MAIHQISEAAALTGFSADTLRYYERIGLLVPSARSDAGYRLYDDADLDTARFIANAKTAGLALDDIAELVGLWHTGECGPVRDRLHELVCERANAARHQVGELAEFADQLDHLALDLAGTNPPESCGPGCACTAGVEPIRLSDPATIACSLPDDQLVDRLSAWQALLERVIRTERDEHEVRIVLPVEPALAGRAAELTALEQECCGGVVDLTSHVTSGAVTIVVRGPNRDEFLSVIGDGEVRWRQHVAPADEPLQVQPRTNAAS